MGLFCSAPPGIGSVYNTGWGRSLSCKSVHGGGVGGVLGLIKLDVLARCVAKKKVLRHGTEAPMRVNGHG